MGNTYGIINIDGNMKYVDEIYDFMKFILFGLCICTCICVGISVSLILLIENDIQDGSN